MASWSGLSSPPLNRGFHGRQSRASRDCPTKLNGFPIPGIVIDFSSNAVNCELEAANSMDSRLSIFKNTLALSVPNVLNPFISFILVLVISHYIGVKGLGEYSLVLSYLGIFNTLAALGLEDLVVREVTRRPDDAHMFFLNAGIFGSISSLLALVAMDVLVAVMGYEKQVVYAAFLCSLSRGFNHHDLYGGYFSVCGKSGICGFHLCAGKSSESGYMCVALASRVRNRAAIWCNSCSRIFGFLVMSCFYVKVLGVPRGKLNLEVWRILMREAPTFTSIAIFSTIHLSIAQILLSKLQSVESVGIFSAADRLLAICKTVPVAFSSALLPFFTRHFALGPKDLMRLASDSLRYLFVGVFPVVVGTFVLADSIITQIYGQKFFLAGTVLRFHILSLIPFTTVYVMAQVLIATDNQKVDLMINIVAAITNFILNLLLIPHFAELGAVFATLFTVIIFNQLQNLYIRRYLFRIKFTEIVTKVLISSLIMGAFTYALREWNIFLNIAISAIVYGSLIVLLQVVSRDEIEFLERLIMRKARRVDG